MWPQRRAELCRGVHSLEARSGVDELPACSDLVRGTVVPPNRPSYSHGRGGLSRVVNDIEDLVAAYLRNRRGTPRTRFELLLSWMASVRALLSFLGPGEGVGVDLGVEEHFEGSVVFQRGVGRLRRCRSW